ncbi:MAG: hypothetical protein IT431_12870 [Phycisphaerales bacterium]|nr:hypothetical protein [Phycisphaerales bacterium]
MNPTPTPPLPDRLPRALLDIAAEVEADETRLKRHILDAARAGDTGTVIAIVEQWLTTPPAVVLSHALNPARDLR